MLFHLNNVNKIPAYLWKESEHATPKYASLYIDYCEPKALEKQQMQAGLSAWPLSTKKRVLKTMMKQAPSLPQEEN